MQTTFQIIIELDLELNIVITRGHPGSDPNSESNSQESCLMFFTHPGSDPNSESNTMDVNEKSVSRLGVVWALLCSIV